MFLLLPAQRGAGGPPCGRGLFLTPLWDHLHALPQGKQLTHLSDFQNGIGSIVFHEFCFVLVDTCTCFLISLRVRYM